MSSSVPATTAATSSAGSPSLLFNVITAYLEPLLQKHADKTDRITHEDLMASWDAAVAVLRSSTAAATAAAASTLSTIASSGDDMAMRNNKTAVVRTSSTYQRYAQGSDLDLNSYLWDVYAYCNIYCTFRKSI
jgi:hypothetical protein